MNKINLLELKDFFRKERLKEFINSGEYLMYDFKIDKEKIKKEIKQ